MLTILFFFIPPILTTYLSMYGKEIINYKTTIEVLPIFNPVFIVNYIITLFSQNIFLIFIFKQLYSVNQTIVNSMLHPYFFSIKTLIIIFSFSLITGIFLFYIRNHLKFTITKEKRGS